MKYDCNKTIDYLHEMERLCKSYAYCDEDDGCPLNYKGFCQKTNYESVNIVQKWSDEHPEPPKLTKREREFLECLEYPKYKKLAKVQGGVYMHTISIALKEGMFDFIEEGESMTGEELLKLEVEK